MSPDGSSILFQGVKRSIPLDRRRLRLFEARLTAEVAGGRPFTVLVTKDAELQRLNREAQHIGGIVVLQKLPVQPL